MCWRLAVHHSGLLLWPLLAIVRTSPGWSRVVLSPLRVAAGTLDHPCYSVLFLASRPKGADRRWTRETHRARACAFFWGELASRRLSARQAQGGAAPSPPGDRQELPEMGGFSRLRFEYNFEFIFRQKAHYFCHKCCNIRPFCYNG